MIKCVNEATRNQLINKSKNSDNYKAKNRWINKNQCRVANTVKDYNQIDMDSFWKNDELKFKIKVEGHTSNYTVDVEFSNILPKLSAKVKLNKNKLDIKCVYEALMQSLNSSDLKVNCNCPDFKYRFKVWASKYNYNAGKDETRPAKITNPNNNLGSACKHILNILNNAEWLQKIASVIHNYINYCKDNMEYNYSKFIFPKIYGISYNSAVNKLNSEDDTKLKSDEETINLSNALGRIRGRIKPGSNKNPVAYPKK